jgi:hypothetical protein
MKKSIKATFGAQFTVWRLILMDKEFKTEIGQGSMPVEPRHD